MRTRPYTEVDVFSPTPYRGNALAVVHDATGLTAEAMQRFATWTNLSETTFLLPPTDPEADYRVRIFTASQELPFAGHPTLGSAHAWLVAGGAPKRPGRLLQECAAGLVEVRVQGERRLAFEAPPLTRYEPADEPLIERLAAALGLTRDRIRAASWLVNGPRWVGVLLPSAEEVLALRPARDALGSLHVGVVAPQPAGSETDFEVRAFLGDDPVGEDPVTGSLNAGLARWLGDLRLAGEAYVAAQGTALGRSGRVHVRRDGDGIWVGGDVHDCVRGVVRL